MEKPLLIVFNPDKQVQVKVITFSPPVDVVVSQRLTSVEALCPAMWKNLRRNGVELVMVWRRERGRRLGIGRGGNSRTNKTKRLESLEDSNSEDNDISFFPFFSQRQSF